MNTLSTNYAMRPEYQTTGFDLDVQVNPLDATDHIPAGYTREYVSEYTGNRWPSPKIVSRPDYPHGSAHGLFLEC